ncbi:MAG TPA: hypothetical protein VKV96_14010 [Roseiarcus sp.]|nr:hypothetical protein [Roseiarcus sp.]
MWPFRSKPLLEPEMKEWMFEQAEWLLAAHRHRRAFAKAQLLPLSEKVFPSNGAKGHALAERYFADVLRYADATSLQLRLEPGADSGRYKWDGSRYAVQQKSSAAGRYWRRDGAISYDSALLEIPADLIAVLAHEVSHAILDLGAARPPPGDPAFEELRTDFTAVFLGFGFYLAQFRADTRVSSPEAAREFKKLYMYYMNLRELCFATALFCAVHGVERKPVFRRAPAAASPLLKRAFADLDRNADRIALLRAAADRVAALPTLRPPA